MAAADVGEIADRVYRGVLAPLVLGGAMTLGRPIGARVALMIGQERVAGDPDLVSHVELGRVRRARAIAPIDRLGGATVAEWALACALHDLVQSTHPAFGSPLRSRAAAGRLLSLVDAVTERTAAPESVGDALSRHAWFSRVLSIARTDSTVSCWTGTSHFLGVEPPARLLAWPELRRVNVERETYTLTELPSHGGAVDEAKFSASLSRWLAKTPLTDIATCARPAPLFSWRRESLALAATRGGQTLALRALARAPRRDVDAALGRATRALVQWASPDVTRIAFSLLAERALAAVATPHDDGADETRDAQLARAAGAIAARALVSSAPLPADERARTLRALDKMAATAEGAAIAPAIKAALAVAG